jgi:hypothetical protein
VTKTSKCPATRLSFQPFELDESCIDEAVSACVDAITTTPRRVLRKSCEFNINPLFDTLKMKKELFLALSMTVILAACNNAVSYSDGSSSTSASSSSGFNQDHASFKGTHGAAHADGHRLAAENGQLLLNDADYGMVKETDESTLLIKNGKPVVLVNKVERLKVKSE